MSTGRHPKELPWSERHRPRHLGQVVGNTDQIRKLAEWLRDWDDVIFHGKIKVPVEDKSEEWRRFKTVENLNARAVLVSGPPGIGKTTACCLVARCSKKYSVMEFNASDARNRAIIENMSQSLAGNHTLRMGSGESGSLQRSVIVMDECDGMSGGDKGGMQALINMIKTTKSPIICICNDRSDVQVRNLATHCYDLKFWRPDNNVVSKRVKNILEGEGQQADPFTIEAIVEACGQDIRQVINQVQFFGTASAYSRGCQKDTQLMMSPFDACAKLLNKDTNTSVSTTMRMGMFYIDADTMPLMVQENYLRSSEKNQEGDANMSRSAYAAELIAIADSMSDNWEVQSSAAILSTIYPAFLTASHGAPLRPTFPAWLQKRAPGLKAERFVKDMHSRLRATTTCNSQDFVVSNYHDVLYLRMLKPLQMGDSKQCAGMLTACGLSREFFTDQAPILRQPLHLDEGYKRIDGRVKHQLLQELQNLASQLTTVKRKRQGFTIPGGDRDGEAGDDEDDDGRGNAKKKKPRTVGRKRETSFGACSLRGWLPSTKLPDDSVHTHQQKPPQVLLKFIEGHTNSVRRKVQLADMLAPWTHY